MASDRKFAPPLSAVLISVISGVLLLMLGIQSYLDSINDPVYPELQVDSAIFSPLNATAWELTATWDLTFRFKNRNHKHNYSITYEQIEVSLYDGDEFLVSTVQLPPFSQPAKNTTSVPARLLVVGAYVGGGVLSDSVDPARVSMTFGVDLFAWSRFSPNPWSGYEKNLLWLHCGSVQFLLSRNGSVTTSGCPPKLCRYAR